MHVLLHQASGETVPEEQSDIFISNSDSHF